VSAAVAALPVQRVDTDDVTTLRRALGSFATGVTLVTVGGAVPRGMTANSFTSVSLSPALVLVCVKKDAVMHGVLEDAQAFGVSVLAAGQEQVARHFADRSRPMGAGQFDVGDWQIGGASGAPLLDGAVAHFECRKWNSYEGGDHTIYLGKVVALEHRPEREALLFHGGRFRDFAPQRAGAAA
jgi:flavin reductase (DIM6/NTAB) family NADH-FMN oxidoreductase RutF